MLLKAITGLLIAHGVYCLLFNVCDLKQTTTSYRTNHSAKTPKGDLPTQTKPMIRYIDFIESVNYCTSSGEKGDKNFMILLSYRPDSPIPMK